jgi:hypothetical protein
MLRVVIDSQIDVRMFVGGAACSRSAEHDRVDAVDLRDAGNYLSEYLVDFELSGHPSRLGCSSESSNDAGLVRVEHDIGALLLFLQKDILE